MNSVIVKNSKTKLEPGPWLLRVGHHIGQGKAQLLQQFEFCKEFSSIHGKELAPDLPVYNMYVKCHDCLHFLGIMSGEVARGTKTVEALGETSRLLNELIQ